MPDFPDAKAMAAILRRELSGKQIGLAHSECLELVAKQHGFRDWNTFAAAVAGPVEATRLVVPVSDLKPLPAGWEVIGRKVKTWFDVGIRAGAGRTGTNALVIQAKTRAEPIQDITVWVSARQSISAKK